MAVVWTKALFDLAYDFGAEPDGHPNTREEIRLHYERAALWPDMVRRAGFFAQHFGLTSTSRVLLVGAGFGWTVEALGNLGVRAIGTDTSPYVQANKEADVMNEDSMTNASRNRVKSALGGVTLVITEDVMTSLNDAECLALRAQLAKFNAPLCHFVTEFANPSPPFNFNSKSLADWKTLFPVDTIIADGYKYRSL